MAGGDVEGLIRHRLLARSPQVDVDVLVAGVDALRPVQLAVVAVEESEEVVFDRHQAILSLCGEAADAAVRAGRSADELLREDVRREAGEVADALALADELDRDAGLVLHAQHEAALGGAVELGEHEAGDAGVLDEGLGLREPVLAGGRVEHEQHLGDRAPASR